MRHSVPTLGFVRAFSIWTTMPLLTPERPASSSSDQPRASRSARTCCATAAVIASCVSCADPPAARASPATVVVSVNTLSFTVTIVLRIAVLSIVLAALTAGVWGTGDFSGGKASQRANTFAVTFLSQLLGLPVLVLCVIFLSHGGPSESDLVRGAFAGVAGFVGIVLLYRGLAQGAMSIFAPISAVTAALIPMVVGLVSEKMPSPLSLAGALCAIVAIGLVSVSGGNSAVTPRLIGLALASGSMFGIFFAILGKSGSDAGAVAAGGRTPRLDRRWASRSCWSPAPRGRCRAVAWRWSAFAGSMDVGANALFLFASAHGQLTIVAPIASLYPVSTVLLALTVDRERVRPVQLAGLGLAATALVLVAT